MASKKKPTEETAVAKKDPDALERVGKKTTERSILAGLVAGDTFATLAGEEYGKAIGAELVAATVRDVAPTSMIERMLAEQLAVTHAQVLDLHRMAKKAEYYDQKERIFGVVAKMQGEFRKTVGALRDLRQPPRPIIVAQQANIAQQQIVNGPQSTNEVGTNDA